MKVFKFGGASVKDAEAVRNVVQIVGKYKSKPLLIVISAMGKTTNALEAVVNAHCKGKGDAHELLHKVKMQHQSIVDELFDVRNYSLQAQLRELFAQVTETLSSSPDAAYDFVYDQIVSLGELVSTKIVSAYLQEEKIANQWLDVRRFLRTDNTYREGRVDFPETVKRVQAELPELLQKMPAITQGFLGGTVENLTTTLGREGSDYTAAIFAHALDAEDLTVWKDVPGILSADPRLIPDAVKIPQLSYHEAIEMTYYGAKVIHPKTIKPLQNKSIPMRVRSFSEPEAAGTVINSQPIPDYMPPVVVIQKNQLLLHLTTNDFSFMIEENLSHIYSIFAKHRIKTNLSQNAAIGFSACIDDQPNRIAGLLHELSEDYTVQTHERLELITLRHYTPAAVEEQVQNREVLLQQKGHKTVQMVVR